MRHYVKLLYSNHTLLIPYSVHMQALVFTNRLGHGYESTKLRKWLFSPKPKMAADSEWVPKKQQRSQCTFCQLCFLIWIKILSTYEEGGAKTILSTSVSVSMGRWKKLMILPLSSENMPTWGDSESSPGEQNKWGFFFFKKREKNESYRGSHLQRPLVQYRKTKIAELTDPFFSC